jgi:hypothetical protein
MWKRARDDKVKRISTAELSPGMYVSELDGPQPASPFTFKGMYVNGPDDIRTLSRQCQYVYVDLGRSDRYAFLRVPGTVET